MRGDACSPLYIFFGFLFFGVAICVRFSGTDQGDAIGLDNVLIENQTAEGGEGDTNMAPGPLWAVVRPGCLRRCFRCTSEIRRCWA